MKWIGQHIWDFISRFRSDVYLESVDSGTIASGGNLGLDSNNKVVKATGVSSATLASTVTVTDSNAATSFPIVFHDESNGLLDDTGSFIFNPGSGLMGINNAILSNITVNNTADTATAGSLYLKNLKGGAEGDIGDTCGKLGYWGNNNDSTPEAIMFAQVYGEIVSNVNTDEAGKLGFQALSSDGNTASLKNALTLTGHATDSTVAATIGYGATSTTTIAGTLTMGSTAFVNNSGVVQVATQGTIDHDSLANFVANEHIDWTGDVSASSVIHTENITDLHGAGVDGSNNNLLTDNGSGKIISESTLTYSTGILTVGSDDDATKTIMRKQHSSDDGGTLNVVGGSPTITPSSSNKNGGDLSLKGGFSTGSGIGGSVKIQTVKTTSGTATQLNNWSDTVTISGTNVHLEEDVTLSFEGGTDGNYETTLTVADPTADRTITLPNDSGTVALTSDITSDGWHGSTTRIKILPRDFVANDIGRPLMIEDDSVGSNELFLFSFSSGDMFAYIPIPTNYKATRVRIYGSDPSQGFYVYEGDINSKTITDVATGSTNINVEKILGTEVTSDTTNYLIVRVTSNGSTDEIFGGYVTIAGV